MNRPILLSYQLLIAFSDTSTGALLMIAPEFTLRLVGLSAPSDSLIYVSFIGAFVLSVGLACFYGAFLVYRGGCRTKLEIVWVLTAVTRASVAIFVTEQLHKHTRRRLADRGCSGRDMCLDSGDWITQRLAGRRWTLTTAVSAGTASRY